MKKTLFEKSEAGNCYLYVGIEELYGGWMLETGGDPVTLNDLEDAIHDAPECEEEIEEINRVIADPRTYWEPCEEEDIEYIKDWLEAWGIV